MSVLTYFPKSRLSELIGRFGGLSREEAVEAASKQLESLRPEADQAIASSILQLEKIVAASAKTGHIDQAAIKEMIPLCDQIITLAGTYGYKALDKATRSLCDLLDGLMSSRRRDLASVLVHVQTIRMVAPGGLPLGDDHIELMLFELHKVLDHHGFQSLGDCPASAEDASIKEAK